MSSSASQDEGFRHYSGKVSRQASVFLLGTLSSVVLGYLFKAYLGRVLGAEALGIYALGLQVVGCIVLLSGLGLPYVLARYVAVYRSRQQSRRIHPLLAQSLRRTLTVSCLGALVLWTFRQPLAIRVFEAPALATYLPLFALLIPLSATNSLLGQYLRGHQEVTRRTLIHHFVQLPVKIAATLALIWWGLGVDGYITAEVISQLLAVGLLWYLSRRLTTERAPYEDSRIPPSQEPKGLDPENQAYGRHLLGLELLRFLSGRADIVILGILVTTDQVGIYSMAVAAAAFVPTLLRALNSIFGPIISDLHSRDEKEVLERLFKTTTQWCLCLTCPLVMAIVIFAPALMGFFGEPFRAGSTALVWLTLGQLVNVGTGSVGSLLVMSGHQRLELWVSALTTAVTLTLFWLFIPLWGITGAAAAVGAGLAFSNGLRLVLVGRHLSLFPYDGRSLRFILPLGIAGMGIWWVAAHSGQASMWGLLIALLVSYGLLALTLWPFLVADDRTLWRQAWRRKTAAADKERRGPGD